MKEDLLKVRDALTDLVRREYDYLDQFYAKLWRQPLAKRLRSGRAVAGLKYDRVLDRKRGIVRFRCQLNESRFRAGDVLRLSQNSPMLHYYEVTWYGEDEGWVGAVFYQKHELNVFLEEDLESAEWTLDEAYVDLRGLYQKAFDSLTESAAGRERVLPTLAGILQPTIDLATFDQAVGALQGKKMNESQQEAAAMALAAEPYALIQGPPGTGKTRTLAMIVEQLLARGERVLVTSLTHRSIHEALNKVCDVVSVDRVAKIGVPVYDPGLIAKEYGYFRECPLSDSGDAYVLGATPFTLWGRRLSDVMVDTVIIDESSQVTPSLAVMAMLKAQRYLFVGDHQQLPPVVAHLDASDLDIPSIFTKLRSFAESSMLTTCYRMNADLCRWPSTSFYHERLRSAPDTARRQLVWPSGSSGLAAAWTSPSSSVVVRVEHDERRTASREEAELVVTLVIDWLDAGQSPNELGVVVPYRRQANSIRRLLRRRSSHPKVSQVTIDTVDRFQGSEREAMILSFTASDPAFIEQQGDFLFQPQRLNVAVTRARSKRLLILSESLVETATALAAAGHQAAGLLISLIEESDDGLA